MPLQTDNLRMIGLGVLVDQPPQTIQPPLVLGNHLRWAFDPKLGFPWHGFYLFRRPHLDADSVCFSGPPAPPPDRCHRTCSAMRLAAW